MEATYRLKQGEICWTDLMATDLEGQSRFYEGLLGWSRRDVPTDVGPIYRLFDVDGLTVAGASLISADMAATGMSSAWSLYIAVDDIDSIVPRVVELGGKVIMPPMDVMDQGRMVGIADPTGGAVFFWQAGEHKGAEVFGSPGSLMWADLSSENPEAAIAFFKELLAWDVDAMSGGDMPYWQINVDGVPEGGIMPMPPGLPEDVPSNWLPYFCVESVAESVGLAESLGGRVEAPPMEASGVTFAVLSDPAGGTFCIMESLD